MSILLHSEILNEYNNGNIVIKPFDKKQLGPNSYDVKLGNTLKVYIGNVTDGEILLDTKKDNPTTIIHIPEEGYVLRPNILYLANTVEKIGSDHFVPMYEGRSSIGRLGICSHVSAGFGDIGFKSNWTLEILVTYPVKIYPEMRIGQVYFHSINKSHNEPQNRYNGKYKNQTHPQQSKSYLDFKSQNQNSYKFDPNIIGC